VFYVSAWLALAFFPPSPGLSGCVYLSHTCKSIHAPFGCVSPDRSSDHHRVGCPRLSRTRRWCSMARWGGGVLKRAHSPAPAAVMECVCDQRVAAAERWAGQRRRRAFVCFRGCARASICARQGAGWACFPCDLVHVGCRAGSLKSTPMTYTGERAGPHLPRALLWLPSSG
jgi:hypothetical protein